MLHRRSFMALLAGGIAIAAAGQAEAHGAPPAPAGTAPDLSLAATGSAEHTAPAAGEPREMQYYYRRRYWVVRRRYYVRRRYWRRRYYW